MSKKMHSLGRIGTPESVINIAKQLIVDKNSWITGSVVNLDGGLVTTKIASLKWIILITLEFKQTV